MIRTQKIRAAALRAITIGWILAWEAWEFLMERATSDPEHGLSTKEAIAERRLIRNLLRLLRVISLKDWRRKTRRATLLADARPLRSVLKALLSLCGIRDVFASLAFGR